MVFSSAAPNCAGYLARVSTRLLVASVLIAACTSQPKVSKAPAPLVTNRARVAPMAGSVFDGKTASATLSKGRVLVSAWGETVMIQVGSHKVTSEAAVFWVDANADVGVYDGVVMVDGQKVTRKATREEVEAVIALEAPSALEQRQWFLVNKALRYNDVDDALARLSRLADQNVSGAEAALLKKGQVELAQKHDPTAARLTLQSQLARYPLGALAPDAEVALLEAMLEQKQWAEVRSGAKRFAQAHPKSERLTQVAFIDAVALSNSDARDELCRALGRIERAGLAGTQLEPFDALSAQCVGR